MRLCDNNLKNNGYLGLKNKIQSQYVQIIIKNKETTLKHYYQLIFMGAIDHRLLPKVKDVFFERIDELGIDRAFFKIID